MLQPKYTIESQPESRWGTLRMRESMLQSFEEGLLESSNEAVVVVVDSRAVITSFNPATALYRRAYRGPGYGWARAWKIRIG